MPQTRSSSVHAVAKDEESGNLVISATKSNLAPGDAASLSARLVNHEVPTEDGTANVGRVEWLGETNRDARDLLGGATDEDERSDLDEASRWLTEHLGAKGWALAGEVIRAGKRDGIAERTLQRARKKDGIATTKVRAGWIWAQPGKTPQETDPEDDGDDEGANPGNAVNSEDAKAPTNVHVHVPWHLGAFDTARR